MLVSVIIPCYNSDNYLANTLNSVLNQNYKNIEIILIDDGSIDETSKIIESFKNKDKRIRIFQQKHQGVSAARNLGINKAKGEFITFLDSDDLYEKDKILEQVNRLKSTNKKICYCGNKYIFNNRVVKHVYNIEGKILESYILNKMLIHLNDWMISSNLIKKNKIKFLEDVKYGEDFNFFMKILSLEEVVVVNKQLTNYFIRETSSSFKKNIRINFEDDYISEFKGFLLKTDKSIYSEDEKVYLSNLLDRFLRPQVTIRNIDYCNKKIEQLSEFEEFVLRNFRFTRKNIKSSIKFYLIYFKIYFKSKLHT